VYRLVVFLLTVVLTFSPVTATIIMTTCNVALTRQEVLHVPSCVPACVHVFYASAVLEVTRLIL